MNPIQWVRSAVIKYFEYSAWACREEHRLNWEHFPDPEQQPPVPLDIDPPLH